MIDQDSDDVGAGPKPANPGRTNPGRANLGRTNLGRGLDALFGDGESSYESADRTRSPRTLAIELVRPNPKQPRRRFDDEDLDDLVASIREQGILQPILVRPSATMPDLYEIVAGERRWRAAQRAQLHEVPVVVRELDDSTALQIAIIENIQRENLTPIEEADGYRRLREEFGHTQEKIGLVVGKSRSHITNTLRLLELPEPVRDLVDSGQLSAGHARAVLTCADPEAVARSVVEQGLNVRQTEKLARGGADPAPKQGRGSAKPVGKGVDLQALEREMSTRLGLRVSVDPTADGHAGAVTIRYQSLDQFDGLLQRLGLGGGRPRG